MKGLREIRKKCRPPPPIFVCVYHRFSFLALTFVFNQRKSYKSIVHKKNECKYSSKIKINTMDTMNLELITKLD